MLDDWEVQEFEFCGFEWDNEKAEINWKAHQLDFEDAKSIFRQPIIAAPHFENGEDRWRCIGKVNGVEIVVVFTEREIEDGIYCRIISAWVATPADRRRYYEVLGR